MAEQHKYQTIKGMRDILPPDSALWNRVEQTARAVFESFGFGEIRLPIFEATQLFARSVGMDTDIVSKEMYVMPDEDTAHIYGLQRALVQWEIKPGDFKGAESFGDLAGSLLVFIEQAHEEGSIRFEDVGLEAAKDLLDAREELGTLISRGKGTNGAETWNSLVVLVERIRVSSNRLVVGDVLSPRPEATASVCRAYIEHGMQVLPGDAKLYYIGPMFRRERPQKGRYRQFYQIGAEVLSSNSDKPFASNAHGEPFTVNAHGEPRIDADVLEMLTMFLGKLQLSGAKLYLNSIGDKNCRPAYVEKLREALRKVKDQLGADSQRRIETNPLRVLDSKLPEEQAIIETLPRISDNLCAECRTQFAELQEQLKLRGIAYELNWRLVRGLDYYMRTTFEITAPGLGSQDAICGGGRYDGLVELLGGPPTKGIGFAIGTDRLILSLQETAGAGGSASAKANADQAAYKLDVFLVWFGAAAYPAAVKLARRLRLEGLRVELPADEMKFRKSLSLADRLGARYAVIIGEDELASGAFSVKRLADGTQQKFEEEGLVEYLRGA